MRLGKRENGFTYLLALLAVSAVGLAAVATAEIWSTTRRREKEAELVWVGGQFRQAIGLYYERSPGLAKQYPQNLEDLLEDRRFISVQRYLRRIYPDPLTGKADWILIDGPGGGIVGVRSASTTPVISAAAQKQAGGDWRFIYDPPAISSSATSKPPAK